MLSNPARGTRRMKIIQASIIFPNRGQFKQLIAAIRESDGRRDSQANAMAEADLVELLAYSGCRIHEAVSLTWGNLDWEKNSLRVTGGERGTKNNESRSIPMTDALRALLMQLRGDRNPNASECISPIKDAKRCLHTASRRLGF